MPTVPELSKRFKEILELKRSNPSNEFPLNTLAKEIIRLAQEFLRAEKGQDFPDYHQFLGYGESYRNHLRTLGVPFQVMEGTLGLFVGGIMVGNSEIPLGPPTIAFDLEPIRQEILGENTGSAIIKLCLTAIEELSHLLNPTISDKEINEETTRLTEKFLNYEFTEEQKMELAELVAGEPRDGIFRIKKH